MLHTSLLQHHHHLDLEEDLDEEDLDGEDLDEGDLVEGDHDDDQDG